jgi:hypothetical protein
LEFFEGPRELAKPTVNVDECEQGVGLVRDFFDNVLEVVGSRRPILVSGQDQAIRVLKFDPTGVLSARAGENRSPQLLDAFRWRSPDGVE